MELAISKIEPAFFSKDLTITEFSLYLVAEYEHMQETLALLKMLAQSQQSVQGKQFPAPMPIVDYGRNAV